jgi:hypothetical protein
MDYGHGLKLERVNICSINYAMQEEIRDEYMIHKIPI